MVSGSSTYHSFKGQKSLFYPTQLDGSKRKRTIRRPAWCMDELCPVMLSQMEFLLPAATDWLDLYRRTDGSFWGLVYCRSSRQFLAQAHTIQKNSNCEVDLDLQENTSKLAISRPKNRRFGDTQKTNRQIRLILRKTNGDKFYFCPVFY